MKKVLSLVFILTLAASLFVAPVSAATYQDGEIIYSQDFDSVTKVDDLGYDANARARVCEYNPSENISLALENKALKVTAAAATNGLFFVEILEADKIKGVEKFTIQYDLKVDTATDDGNSAVGMLLYWDIAKGKDSGNLYACLQFRNAYKTFLNNGRAVTTGTQTNWIDPFALTPLTTAGISNAGLGTTHTIRMEVNGPVIASYIDGKLVHTFENAVVADGPIALLVYNNTTASPLVAIYDNIKIWAGNGPEPTGSNDTTAATTTAAGTTSPTTSNTIVPVVALCGLAAGALIVIKRRFALSK
ncbi:MAG: hypothetical protein GX303_03995 [Clostridiales bacterium]|nr:hypothetical protein [Clostridiales bacterium]